MAHRSSKDQQAEQNLLSTGTVIAAYGRSCLVEYAREKSGRKTIRCHLRGRDLKPVCGDRVRWKNADQTDGVVESIEPRTNHFPRVLPNGKIKIVAANLDLVLITVAPKPPPTRDLINRYVVACHSVGVSPCIVLNKTDLLDEESRAHWQADAALYQTLGYPFFFVCAKEPESTLPLQAALADKRGILVGQSGVGKSSLTNNLVPGAKLAIAELSTATHKGTHTTTAATLHHLPGGGELIDSPGVWEYGIWNMSCEDIAQGFKEFEPYLGQCRFSNCQHRHEPGCAVAAAARRGSITGGRFESYQRIASAAQPSRG